MPPDEAAVVGVVQQARASGHTIKAVGAGHSWSDIAATDGVQVSLDAIRGLRSVDPQAGTATFGAGTRLRDAVAALDAEGLAFPILGSIDHQSLAGATATATHGSSLSWGNLSSLVQGARLVDGRGELREFGHDHPALDGVRVHLGALGLLTELTMQVVPAFSLREERFTVSWGDAMTRLPDLARESEYVKLWWLPHTDPVVVFRYVRTDAPPTVRPLARWVDEQVVNRFLFSGLLKLGSWFEPSVRWNNRIVGRSYFSPSVAVGPSAHMFTLAMPPRHREAEHAVGLEHATEALHRLRKVIDRRGLSVDFIVEARFVRGDSGWMSPAHGRDTAQIGAYMYRKAGADKYFDGFSDEIADLGARPHWGKEHRITADECASLYPRYADFRALAGELDPDGVFRNAFVDRVLGPVGSPST
ncbi:MAG: FAD/FMN-containing dehydrogenase [Myxococcota bacterium]|jgi:FAD/FMN-containing dehydrogenase